MRYFVIAGEASGDLHASNLLRALKEQDPDCQFKGLGGDLMAEQGCELVQHYRDMAYMGFVDVVLHLRTILGIMSKAKQAAKAFCPDVVILVDYPSFNLQMAKYVKKNMPGTPVFYYIAPKVWAWKSWRVKSIRKYVDRVFSILPFEVEWFGQRGCEVSYVGNPCVDAVENRSCKGESLSEFASRTNIPTDKPLLALLPGSRVSELKGNLPDMLKAASAFPQFHIVIAGAPAMPKELYSQCTKEYNCSVVCGETYQLLQQAEVAVVTSGTATLETALMRVPQVVVYQIAGGRIVYWILRKIIRVANVSLVNLIADRQVVTELLGYNFNAESLKSELGKIIAPAEGRQRMLDEYAHLADLLGTEPVSRRAAREMIERLNNK